MPGPHDRDRDPGWLGVGDGIHIPIPVGQVGATRWVRSANKPPVCLVPFPILEAHGRAQEL